MKERERVLLYGTDGHTPLAVEGADSPEVAKAKALLMDCFGAFCQFQVKTGEWSNPARGSMNLLNAITSFVGVEALMKRWEAAGLEIETPDQMRAREQAEVEKVKNAAATIDREKPFKAIPGGKA